MNWNSWSEFWAMGGYARFVWPSYGLLLLLIVAELWMLRHTRQTVQRQLQAWLRNRGTGGAA